MQIDSFRFERSLETYDHLAQVAASRKLALSRYCENGRTVLVVEDPTLQSLDSDLTARLLSQNLTEKQNGILNNCFDIARRALTECGSDGLLKGSGTSNFIDWANHWINWIEMGDDTKLAFDLTASSNIDKNVGNFDVFAIRASSMDDLLASTALHYGGDWQCDERF